MDNENKLHISLQKTTTASELAQKAMDKTEKTFKQMVPQQYHHHQKVFSEKVSHWFPPNWPWDHAINLLPNAPKTLDCKVYPLALTKGDVLISSSTNNWTKGISTLQNPHTPCHSSSSTKRMKNFDQYKTIGTKCINHQKLISPSTHSRNYWQSTRC